MPVAMLLEPAVGSHERRRIFFGYISFSYQVGQEIMNNQPLIIHGSDDFKKAVLKIAIHQDLPISFDDLIMQNDFLSYKDVDYPDRKVCYPHCSENFETH